MSKDIAVATGWGGGSCPIGAHSQRSDPIPTPLLFRPFLPRSHGIFCGQNGNSPRTPRGMMNFTTNLDVGEFNTRYWSVPSISAKYKHFHSIVAACSEYQEYRNVSEGVCDSQAIRGGISLSFGKAGGVLFGCSPQPFDIWTFVISPRHYTQTFYMPHFFPVSPSVVNIHERVKRLFLRYYRMYKAISYHLRLLPTFLPSNTFRPLYILKTTFCHYLSVLFTTLPQAQLCAPVSSSTQLLVYLLISAGPDPPRDIVVSTSRSSLSGHAGMSSSPFPLLTIRVLKL